MKTCTRCKRELDFADFPRNRRRTDGLDLYCRQCNHEKYKAQHEKHYEKRLIRQRELYHRDVEYTRARRRKWYAAKADRIRAYMRNWRDDHQFMVLAKSCNERGRVANLPGRVTHDGIRARVAMFGFRCWVCGAPWEEIDHVKPMAVGGLNLHANLRPACAHCNRTGAGQKLIGYRFRGPKGWVKVDVSTVQGGHRDE